MVTFHSADDALTLLIHLGYLGYDAERKEVYIPNKEIRDEFVNAIDGDQWTFTQEAIAKSGELLHATLECDEETVAKLVEEAHRNNTAILTYNNENSLSCVIQIAYYQAQDDYMFVREMPAGKGFCDIVFLPRKGVDKPAILVELKWNKDVQTALNQIRERHYSDHLYAGLGVEYAVAETSGNTDQIRLYRADGICREKRCQPAWVQWKGKYPEKENEGYIEVQSPKGAGAEFRVYLPTGE